MQTHTKLIQSLVFIGMISLLGTVQAETFNCPCRVVEVIAGDTVYIENHETSSRKIWLAGIDAPQLKQLYGEQSRKHLSDLVLNEYVMLETIQPDRYGRITARLLKDRQDINLQQIRDGYAWYYRQDDGLTDSQKITYEKAQERAQSETLGLWESEAIPPWDFREQ